MRQFVLIKVDQRSDNALNVQKILTEYGSAIFVRLGLHERQQSDEGIIFLEVDPETSLVQMVSRLENLPGVTVKLVEM